MGGQELYALEEASYQANQAFFACQETLGQADSRLSAAKEDYQAALSKMSYGETPTEKDQKDFQNALQEMKAAEEMREAANSQMEDAAQAAQEAADAVEAEKEALRASRSEDTAYVVHGARIECTCGMRESRLLLENSHGVLTRQFPQMTVKDFRLDENVINFGGCTSTENPTTREAARRAAEKANEAIQEQKASEGFLGKVVRFFTGDGSQDTTAVSDSVVSQCVGECIGRFISADGWRNGHEKVTVNGEAPILRRCELDCIYGGHITILVSGQPE